MNVSASENIQIAIEGVWTHRFRSLLTILGIVIGITTVVTVASLLTGLREGVVVFFQELGPDNVFVYRTSGDPNGPVAIKERKRRSLKPEFADYIRKTCLSVQQVGLELIIPAVVDNKPITARVPGYETETINLAGAEPNMEDISPRDFASGRFFTAAENQRAAHVVVIGSNVAQSLFPAGDAIGHPVMIDGAEYTVIGVYAKAKGGFFGENGQDDAVVFPLRTAETHYPQIDNYFITAKALPGKRNDAYDEVRWAMRRLRHLQSGDEDDFAISTPDQIIHQFDQITGLIGLVAIAISGLGLLVGGIGVMNIMLMSVTERTKEIGIRKAIGARRRDIIGQFLVEAVALTGAGGTLGVVIAVLITMALGAVIPSLPSAVPAWAVIAGFGVSMAVGVFFGVWPAVKAASLDPVEALRYE
ncbi:MAG TPA: ABC transporter permease [Bryobacteraceae bacterium]|nr:ABC transporter permease [Bryobacteraceae bacterium]